MTGRITKQGRSHARGMLVEAAWAAARVPGPLRAFFLRIQGRRGKSAAAVATARKLTVLVWHLLSKDEDCAWTRPALLEAKLRKVELAAGHSAAKGRRQGRAHAHNSQEVRERERAWLAQAEHAYTRFIANWQTRPPEGRTDAANRKRADLAVWRACILTPTLGHAVTHARRKTQTPSQKSLVEHIRQIF